MARNEEKATQLFNRWTSLKASELKRGRVQERSATAQESVDIEECKRVRRELIGQITRKISKIQNAGLGEHVIRDLNDEINKLMRARHAWEVRIKELGGPDLTLHERAADPDRDGQLVMSADGGIYKYYGAARKLKGVRELLEQQETTKLKRTRADIARGIESSYYGYRDDMDGMLSMAEQDHEAKLIKAEVTRWNKEKAEIEKQKAASKNVATIDFSDSSDDDELLTDDGSLAWTTLSQIKLPTDEEIKERLLHTKRQQAMKEFMKQFG
eukprot:TRINITY_DN6370_c0_g1_i1.p1 TRINITY_DN6370_c0_g1~~TRINITY_DN6370_c0_g1_i1.p1  ORF type:complete len:270 (+),score=88.10 TRINITY_DN6370_c0_g1_i1:110-919(+)